MEWQLLSKVKPALNSIIFINYKNDESDSNWMGSFSYYIGNEYRDLNEENSYWVYAEGLIINKDHPNQPERSKREDIKDYNNNDKCEHCVACFKCCHCDKEL